jgi:hypothetical protein
MVDQPNPGQSLARDLDLPKGESYVEAVTAAGQRSRAMVYFILILSVLTFAALRENYGPNWTKQRYQTSQDLQDCYVRAQCDIRYIFDDKPEFAYLVVMNQVLAPHAIRIGRFGRLVELCVGLLPSALYFYL